MVEDFLIWAIGQRALQEGTLGQGAMALLHVKPPHEGFEDCPMDTAEIRAYFKARFKGS